MNNPFTTNNGSILSYSEALNWLFYKSKGGLKYDLSRIKNASLLLNSPEKSFRVVHVGGTNGKGSVATKIASALMCAGYTVGLYTSPHIRSCTERIQVSGMAIVPDQLLTLLNEVYKKVPVEELQLSFFEIITLVAFLFFQQNKVDVAVIEVGLGGRLDATNIVHPCLSIITSIGFDHTDLLGNTIEKITREKAGIIKDSIPVVIGPHVDLQIVQSVATEKNAPVYAVRTTFPNFDDENSEIAREGLRILQSIFDRLNSECIEYGISQRPPCRCEVVSQQLVELALEKSNKKTNFSKVYLDVAHNPDGIRKLLQTLRSEDKQVRKYVFVIGVSKEKDLDAILQELLPVASLLIATKSKESERAFSPEIIIERAKKIGFPAERVIACNSVQEAISEKGFAHADFFNCPLVITGTFFIMAEARKFFGYQEFEDPVTVNEASIRRTSHA